MRSNARRASPRRTRPTSIPTAALADPPGGYYLRGNLFKYHAACYLTHAPIECARQVAARPGFDPDAVRGAVLRIDRGADLVCNIARPRTGLEAKFSLRTTVAMALTGVDTASLATWSDALAADPRLAALGDLMRIELMAGWSSSRAELQVTLADGSLIEARHDSGIAAEDVAAQGRRIAAKYEPRRPGAGRARRGGPARRGRRPRPAGPHRGPDGPRRSVTVV